MASIAPEYRADLVELREQFDASLRRSVRMYTSEFGIPVTTSLLSRLARHALGALCRQGPLTRQDGSRSRLRVKVDGNDNVKVYVGSLVCARMRLRPPDAFDAHAVLVEPDGSIPGAFEVPSPLGQFAFFWTWDASIGIVRSFSLVRVTPFNEWEESGCAVYDELVIESTMATRSAPVGAGSDEDNLDDLVAKLDLGGERDEPDGFQTAAFDDDEDENHDEGDTAVGDAG
jgi:hypothetical protein